MGKLSLVSNFAARARCHVGFFSRHPAAYGMQLSSREEALTMLHRHGPVSRSTGCPGPLMSFRPRRAVVSASD